MTEKKQPDWEKIELDYRAGIKTLREIASEHGLSDGAVRKRAKRSHLTQVRGLKLPHLTSNPRKNLRTSRRCVD